MTHANELNNRTSIPKISSEPLFDRALPYDARIECICELVADRRIERIRATSHFFPSSADAKLFQSTRMLKSSGGNVAAQLEKYQTWFVTDEPVAGGLSWTIMYVHNLAPSVVRWLVLKYSDAPPGSEGREAFHLIDVGVLRPSEPRIIGVYLFVPPAMFFEGHLHMWSIDIIDAF
jgi:hypothetical protein